VSAPTELFQQPRAASDGAGAQSEPPSKGGECQTGQPHSGGGCGRNSDRAADGTLHTVMLRRCLESMHGVASVMKMKHRYFPFSLRLQARL
jgi:hypothetical protein